MKLTVKEQVYDPRGSKYITTYLTAALNPYVIM
jgi:hypothetical protein